MDTRTVIVAGLMVGIVFYGGKRMELATDQAGNVVLCRVLRGDGTDAPCDETEKGFARDRFLRRETDAGRAYEARVLATAPVPRFPRPSTPRDRILPAVSAVCVKGARNGGIYGAANGALNGALFGSAIFGIGAVPASLLGAGIGGVVGGASGCVWHVIDYGIRSAF